MHRFFALAFGVLGLQVVASASFELVLAVDPTAGQIDRFDGNTGTYLGSFAKGSALGLCMTLDQANNRVFVSTSSGSTIQSWNYNTGEFLNEFASGAPSFVRGLAMDNSGNLLVSSLARIKRLNANSGALINQFGTSGLTYTGVEHASDGSYFVMDGTNSRLTKFSSSFVQTGFVSVPKGASGSLQWQLAFDGSQGYCTDDFSVFRFGIGGASPVLGAGYSGPNLVNTLGIGVGHATRRYAAGNTVTGPAIQAFSDYGTGFSNHLSFGRPGATTGLYGSIGVVLAPEPGSLVAVGLGLMLFRRRSKNRPTS